MRDKILVTVSIATGFVIAAVVTFGIINLLNLRDNAGYDEYALGENAFAATAECTDEEFLKTADRAAKLISDTIEDGHEYSLMFELETPDDDVFYVWQQRLSWRAKGWKQICRRQIVDELVRAEQVVQAHEGGKTVKVIGMTLSCPVYHEDGSDWYTISASDYDNDGVWDHKSVFC